MRPSPVATFFHVFHRVLFVRRILNYNFQPYFDHLIAAAIMRPFVKPFRLPFPAGNCKGFDYRIRQSALAPFPSLSSKTAHSLNWQTRPLGSSSALKPIPVSFLAQSRTTWTRVQL